MLKKFAEISITKTLRFNLHYFEFRGSWLPELVSRNFVLLRMGGVTSSTSLKLALYALGFSASVSLINDMIAGSGNAMVECGSMVRQA